MPHGCGHGPDDGNADCGHDGESGWGWSGSSPGGPVHKESHGDFYFLLVVAALVLGFLAWVLSPIYM